MQGRSFQATGSRTRSSRRAGAMPLSTTLAFSPVSRYRFGARRGGSILTTRGAGFNGIAATISAAAYLAKTHGRLDDGKPCVVTFVRFRRTASPAICAAVRGNGRRFSNGLMTAGQSELRAAYGAVK